MMPVRSVEHPGRREAPAHSRIALLLLSLTGGGVERSMLRLARAFAGMDLAVDLVVCRAEGPLRAEIPPGVRLVALPAVGPLRARLAAVRAAGRDGAALLQPVLLARHASRALRHLPALADYLAREAPAALIAGKTPVNVMAVLARRRAAAATRIVVSERVALSAVARPGRPAKRRALPALAARFYPEADAIVAVSRGVADDLAACTGLTRESIHVIYNPIVDEALRAAAAAPLAAPDGSSLHADLAGWFAPGSPPVILSAGRLQAQKDYATLIAAFADLRAHRPARLVIFGEGPDRAALEGQIAALGLEADVVLPGHVANPWAWMARAAVFVLSSRYEGFGNVLAEALACGCAVVSTDCPHGPAEILDGGRHGALVPVGDAAALAQAIARALDDPPPREVLIARGEAFGVEQAARAYLALLLAERAPTCATAP